MEGSGKYECTLWGSLHLPCFLKMTQFPVKHLHKQVDHQSLPVDHIIELLVYRNDTDTP